MVLDSGARNLAERAHDHDGVEGGARAGLAARGVVWALIGLLAARVALGGGSGQDTDQSGALRAVADTPFGAIALVLLALGFLAYAGYRVLAAAVGHRDRSGLERTLYRLRSAGEVVLYLAAAGSAVRMLFSRGGSSEQETRSATAAVLGLPGGRWLVGAVGVVMVVVAVALAVRAVAEKHHTERLRGVPRPLHGPVTWLGMAGYVGRSVAVGLVGAFLVDAARAFDPNQAKGLDAALDSVARQPFGSVLMLAAAVGLVCYGLWSFVEARWRDV